jgi:hypothetical protein
MLAVSRIFPDPPTEVKEAAKDFWQLAQSPVVKGASFAQVGSGQLLTQGGKRATNHELVLGRAKATVNPQNFSWENLRPPALAESFSEIRERLHLLPPPSLRPRRVAEDFHVCPIARIEEAAFIPATQTIEAIVVDARGEHAFLRHPYTSRGSEGAERLLACLTATPSLVRFIAGPMRLTPNGLRIEPVAVVVEDKVRMVIQPWIDRNRDPRTEGTLSSVESQPPDHIEGFGQEMAACVRELVIVGLRRADANTLRMWQNLEQHAEALGFARLATVIRPVLQGLVEKASSINWQWRPAGHALLECALLAKVIQEIS